MDVLEPAEDPVDGVFAFAIAVEFAAYGDGGVLRGEDVFGVLECEGDLGEVGLFPLASAVEDDVFHLLGAEFPRFLLPEDPSDGVHDVGFAAAVWPDNARDALVEQEQCLVGEALEAVYFQALQLHLTQLFGPEAQQLRTKQ